MSDKEQMIVVIDDRFWKSAGRDVVSFSVLTAMVGVGVWLDSSALQWIGAILWFLAVVARYAGVENQHKFTISQAREYLDKLEEPSS